MTLNIRPGITGNDLKLAHVAFALANDIADNHEDKDTAITNALARSREVRLFLGDGGPEIVDPAFWISDDEAPLFRAMVDLVLDQTAKPYERRRPYDWDKDLLITDARKHLIR